MFTLYTLKHTKALLFTINPAQQVALISVKFILVYMLHNACDFGTEVFTASLMAKKIHQISKSLVGIYCVFQ